MSRNSTQVNCNQVAGTVNQGIWSNDCDPCATSPYLIPNIQLWHRYNHDLTFGGTLYTTQADILANISDGDAIDQWNDQIGVNHAVQTTGADKPTYYATDKTLKFTTNEHFNLTSAVTYAATDDFTISLSYVQLLSNAVTNEILWEGTGGTFFKYIDDTNIEVSLGGGTQTITGPAIQLVNYTNFTLRRDTGICQIFIAGIPWGLPFTNSNITVIDKYGLATNGYVAAHMQFDRALTDKEIWCLDCYNSNQDDDEEPVDCRIDRIQLDCYGDSDGILTAIMINPIGSVTYLWSNGDTTQTITGLSAGTYTCTMTDSASPTPNVVICTGVVDEPQSALSCFIQGTNPYYGATNNLIDGLISLTVSGGWTNCVVPNISIAWTLNGTAVSALDDLITFNIANADVGTYIATVTDIYGCTTTCTVIILPAVIVNLDIECNYITPPCHGDVVNWALDIDAAGTAPFSISFLGSVTGALTTITGITLPPVTTPAGNWAWAMTAGNWFLGSAPCCSASPNTPVTLAPNENWQITLTDANGATQTCTSNPTDPTALNLYVNWYYMTNLCENGQRRVSINVGGNGGTSPYTWVMTNSSAAVINTGTSWIPNGGNITLWLPADTYTITMTDDNGCTTTDTVVVECPVDNTLVCASSKITCPGICDGTLTYTLTPSTASGYTFLLEISDGSNTIIQTYTPFTSPLTVTGLCPDTYSYEYYSVLVASPFTQTSLGTGSCTVGDAVGIAVIGTVVTSPVCYGGATGTISIGSISGGTGPFTFLWTAPNNTPQGIVPSGQSTNQDLTLLVPGLYNLVVTDSLGCEISVDYTVNEHNDEVLCTIVFDPIICVGDLTSATVIPSGGVGPYTYTWTAPTNTPQGVIPSGQANLSGLTNIGPGLYQCDIIDANGCTSMCDVFIADGTAATNSITGTDLYCITQAGMNTDNGTMCFDIPCTNGGSYQWYTDAGLTTLVTVGSGQGTICMTDLAAGTYYGEVCCNGGSTGNNNVLAIGDYHEGGIIFYLDGNGGGLVCDIFELGELQWGCEGTSISGADGTAIGTGYQNTIDIVAGCSTSGIAAKACNDSTESGYTDWFLPSQDELNEMYLNRAAINYTIANQTGGTQFHTIIYGGSVTWYWSSSEYYNMSSWMQAFDTGWVSQGYSNKDTELNVRAVRAFTGASFANGCCWDGSVTLAAALNMELSAVVVDANECIDCCGEIHLTITGGTPNYNISWTGPNGFTANGLDLDCVDPGWYDVVVTDDAGCVQTGSWYVGTISASLIVTAWYDPTTGYLNSTISGGLPPYYLTWYLAGNVFAYGSSTGSATQGPQLAGNGTYTLEVTDENGCIGYTYIEINNDPHNGEKYACDGGQCLSGSSGPYADLAACVASGCGQRDDKWRCYPDTGCASHPGGSFTSLSDCQSSCTLDGTAEFGCEILCSASGEGEEYASGGDRREDRDDTDKGGQCRVKLSSDTYVVGTFEGPYTDLEECRASCPWCKDEELYEAEA